MNKILLILLSLILISCAADSPEAFQEPVKIEYEKTEYEKCTESYRAIQETVVKLKDVFPDQEDILINFGDFQTSVSTLWFYYTVFNYSGNNSSAIKDVLINSEIFESDIWDLMIEIDSEEKFSELIEKINLQVYPLIENLETIESDLNNISKYSEVQRSLDQIVKNNNDLNEDLPKAPNNIPDLTDAVTYTLEISLDWYDKAYDEIDEIDEIISEYSKCEEKTP